MMGERVTLQQLKYQWSENAIRRPYRAAEKSELRGVAHGIWAHRI
jgi:hypothetical protein